MNSAEAKKFIELLGKLSYFEHKFSRSSIFYDRDVHQNFITDYADRNEDMVAFRITDDHIVSIDWESLAIIFNEIDKTGSSETLIRLFSDIQKSLDEKRRKQEEHYQETVRQTELKLLKELAAKHNLVITEEGARGWQSDS